MGEVSEQIREVLRAAGATGFVHAQPIAPSADTFAQVSVDADTPVVLASVFKIPIVVAYARDVAAGRLDPIERTTREVTALLTAIWTDTAAPPEACEQVRTIMAHQIWPHRLTSGSPGDVRPAAKTGTLPAVRNEAGVVSYPDGRQ
ncbi:serine hydrolase [Phytoactinopolyspora limicola]|uniref:serine hydrolase n=1 Tax=Phytoactinopolyspora limicola TaxID=2715536 RepID=UPI001FE7E4E2|nr:serine hydrolase [Phytoactinopolyspora limicola]